jgi:hypothetical protein
MRFENKDFALLIPATLLAIGGLGPDDPWVVGPCLFLSWVTFIAICVIHEGPWSTRTLVGVVLTVILFGVGYRRFNSIYRASAEKKDGQKPTVQEIGTAAEQARQEYEQKQKTALDEAISAYNSSHPVKIKNGLAPLDAEDWINQRMKEKGFGPVAFERVKTKSCGPMFEFKDSQDITFGDDHINSCGEVFKNDKVKNFKVQHSTIEQKPPQ